MDRRLFIEKSAFGFIALNTTSVSSFLKTESKLFVFIASWTKDSPGKGGEGGIHTYQLNDEGFLIHISTIHEDLNIGNLCISNDNKFLYAVEEVKDFNKKISTGGGVYAYSIDPINGSLSFINKQPTMGAFPCFLSIDKTRKSLIVANHGSYDSIMKTVKNKNGDFEVVKIFDDGSVAMFPLNEDGSIKPIAYLDVHKGNGTHPFFQQSPHPHSVIFDNSDKFAIVCDKGNDTITTYSVDKNKNILAVKFIYKTKVGIGPRHAVFHPKAPLLFVINEAVSTITSYHFNKENGKLTEINTLPTLPIEFTNTNYPADIRIHPNGQFLYGSNRGHDSIVTFQVNQETGKLTLVGYTSLNGKTPREFNISSLGKYMLVGNQDSNSVSCFSIDSINGSLKLLKDTNKIPKPVCIQFINI
jgi:6-phosphogluconolactonase